jgi:drug/metabolite transporter (DMT)-like permease
VHASNVAAVRQPTADLMLLTTVTLWGLNFVTSKYVITHGISPLAYSAPRYATAACIFALLTLLLERSLRMGRRDLALLTGAAVVLFVNQVGFVYALDFTTASTVALVFGTLPIFTVLIATLTGIEQPRRRILLAGAISFAGVGLVAAGAGGDLSANLKGDALALLSCFMWAAYSVAIAPLMTRHSPQRISAYVLSMSAVLLLLAGSGQIARESYDVSGLVWTALVFAVVGPLVLTNVLWFTAIDRVGPSRAALFANLQFFLAAVFGVILLSETIAPLQVVGGAAIAAAILLSRYERAPAPQPVE